ncbi:methyltransferase domain-containing protein [Roseovarius atlanticus]|uniref:methyltransferase domain-containing protein n=1 Tax=Roseovarius atlanticus TaxID=1641875 RepID=UPI001C93C95A|nr:methyltransferase domain-containing protein [Roseovarius atlanticus]MBY5988427.1 methyltransferase domain-containing protein [Roseovarius atlanticus]MBY6123818.1 methyltransferase domain-containing protein [Roseovarius atlanticus]MBY6148313.1 methyltransferase domain-containing protein [Roseovarius atlanticus]
MTNATSISDHWGKGDVYARILDTMKRAGLNPDTVTVEQLAPVDHFHARGFPATVELADALPVSRGDRLVDIGCGLGGPARYLARRFGCEVDGIDITAPFVEAANKLSELVGMQDDVRCVHGDGQKLPFKDATFDGGYTQHVTMNVPDRAAFFAEAFRVLKPGAFFALTEHGLGETGAPHHPVPWSEDGSGAYLMRPADTVAVLERAGFAGIEVTDTGAKYVEGYKRAMDMARKGETPVFGVHILLGPQAPQIVQNAARNIEERRTHPVQIICVKPG